MAPEELKQEFGDQVTFWGGGVDTQKTLPFGTVEDVRKEVCSRLKTFGKGGGYIFNSIHNVQARVPIENVLAMYETVRDCGRY
jgi:uroporphyrinogen-III decarboxylase